MGSYITFIKTSTHVNDLCSFISHIQVVRIDLSDLDIGERRLGKGGYGSVYEGYWKKNGGMTVAVKVTKS